MLRERENLILIRSTAVIGSRGHKHTHSYTDTLPTHLHSLERALQQERDATNPNHQQSQKRKPKRERERENEKAEPSWPEVTYKLLLLLLFLVIATHLSLTSPLPCSSLLVLSSYFFSRRARTLQGTKIQFLFLLVFLPPQPLFILLKEQQQQQQPGVSCICFDKRSSYVARAGGIGSSNELREKKWALVLWLPVKCCCCC